MKIQSSCVNMSSSSHSQILHTKEESLNLWINTKNNSTRSPINITPTDIVADIPIDKLEISDNGRLLAENSPKNTALTNDVVSNFELSDEDKQKIILIQDFVYYLTGKKIKFYIPKNTELKNNEEPNINVNNPSPPKREGWGINYNYSETYRETQAMSFSSNGQVKTSDGRTITFDVSLNVSSEFLKHEQVSIKAGDALIDPLVINFDNPSAELTDTKIAFDIDCDGKEDQISYVKKGSGFLAYDKNNDGIINDGNELFGPKTGDGFLELAEFDEDNNGWIDENDSIYNKLRIWTIAEDGTKKLFALGQKGIGAIYLENVNTAFSLKSQQNNLNGKIQKSGFFLRENGTAGTIQHIDLAL